MARFTFKMPAQWLRWAKRSNVSERPFRTMHLDADPEILLGPGWFDSSWDLEQGLLVREGPPGDARLLEWLDDCVARHARKEAARASGLPPALLLALRSSAVPSAAAAAVPATVPTLAEFDTGGLELVA